ncbi:MAG: indole-3-glycerol phosphate synthase TrpC [Propionibacteriaceae bacterium]|jgi:indole-3-glycerol phosphate synthase|nr:indole-3-glycerol phosphate synthase TrpC [Propionibacteriaceae bacterium]
MVSDILAQIAAATRRRVERDKSTVPPTQMRHIAEQTVAAYGVLGAADFHSALARPGLSFICEVKRASPSKGLIAPDCSPVRVARDYQAAGAAAVSVLTEPDFFLGHDSDLAEVAAAVGLPVLRKDFVVDPYQLDQARVLGASAVLLIAALLEDHLASFVALADRLGLAALVEVHDEAEAATALEAGAQIIGVNHRDLKTFDIDLGLSERLRPLVPADRLFVAESGITGAADVRRLKDLGVDAILVGERLMRADDQMTLLREWAEA